MQKVQSFPVGRVTFLYLRPQNFQEYLEATAKQALLQQLQGVPIKNSAHLASWMDFIDMQLSVVQPEIVKIDTEKYSLSDLSIIY